MEFFKIRKDIPFMRYALTFNIISFITFLMAVAFLGFKGLNFSIEFTGGLIVEARYEQAADLDKIRVAMEGLGVKDPQVQTFGTPRDVLIRMSVKDSEIAEFSSKSSESGKAEFNKEKFRAVALVAASPEVAVQRVEFVGPQVGRELAENGALALFVTSFFIVLYLAFRFEWKFGVAAIIANLHDIIIILGFFSFFQWEFSLPVLAAVLAVLGYSVNESVVVADRIRENFRKMRRAPVTEIIDNAITRTMSRTIITHGCTQIAVLSMLIFGGAALHYFAVALTIGICFGIYSSVLVMAPLVMWLGVRREDLVRPVQGNKEGAVV
ncbi:MAG: protein translocase subunit SecF [Betaproteobacteria bacterium]|nr:protein translocase subunit SecF [Betaproteobacteria bacterium]